MNAILFDSPIWNQLLPITYTRPCAEIRCGIETISRKWEIYLDQSLSFASREFLKEKYPTQLSDDNLWIAGNVFPNKELLVAILALKEGQSLVFGGVVIATRANRPLSESLVKMCSKGQAISPDGEKINYTGSFSQIEFPWNIFEQNGEQIQADIELLGLKQNPESIQNDNTVLGDQVYVEEGAQVRACILNSESGPIHIGKDAEIMEGSVIRGPFSLGEHATLKMAAKVYGPTTIGPHCKVGGEVTNIVMFAYSNKGHDGFIGNSVIGEWCNFGADTNSSNLKNNYSPVRVWSYPKGAMVDTGLQFCGVIAADHCKTGINTMLNTGTVMGVSANVFGGGFPDKFIPSFSWGGAEGMTTFKINKAFEVADNMMKRRGLHLEPNDKNILQHIFLSDTLYRS